ncbi:hypothetical protein PG985_013540 [Apiospora marii]|uniref:uncharacterized protein n=1 Tax=Apiospora marii TaxID=335849 RepID=UPI003130E24C
MPINLMDSSENRGPQLLAVVITFLVTATAANAMRCYTRIGIVKAFGVDDWFMLIAYVSEGAWRNRGFWWLCYIWYGATMMFSKISIGVFILRVTTNRYHAWTARAITVLTAGSCGAFILVTMFQCTPISAFWEEVPGVGQSSCIHGRVIRDLAYIFSAGTLLIDLTLVVLPLVIVWKLKMSLKTKFGLSFLIFSGLVASVGVAVRFAYLDDLTQPDFLFDTLDIAIWSAVESGLAVTAGSLATLKPLFRLMSRKLGLRTAAVTRGSSGIPGLPCPSLIASPLVAPEKCPLVAVALRPSSSSSPKTSIRLSMTTSTVPSVWIQDHGNHHELPVRPASTAPTLPRLSTGTWRFSREDINDLEKGTTYEKWADTSSTMKPLL